MGMTSSSHWIQRRVTVVCSDGYHAISLFTLKAPVRHKVISDEHGLPVIEGPIEAIEEKARNARPDFFKDKDVVGIMVADWSMMTEGAIVWITQSELISQHKEKGAEKLVPA
jgi:hypothetical protein